MKKVNVVPYDRMWPQHFLQEADKLKKAMRGACVAIHHVGSTAVPGLPAKPNIDIIAEVRDLRFPHTPLEKLGYEYQGGFSLPLRKSFTYRTPHLNVNLHVFEHNDPEVELNVRFRDYLRTHPETCAQYAALKYALVKKKSSHVQSGIYKGYTLGKHGFIQDILHKAGFKRLRFVIAAHDAEWEAVKAFRKRDLPASKALETLLSPAHKHLLFYRGTTIIGYAHVELFTPSTAMLHSLLIHTDEAMDPNTLMGLVRKWLTLEGYDMISHQSQNNAPS
ncbi:GrpB family protein [Candidatus Hepatobacter penaei]|uniref:GrpB family protein n=1 Tax=Candidatus Hepatobacter penaei TaxID=1274402 RepID=UPI0009E4C7B5|nr:GrpB family protein [Candidatus Hepatobacter penaei]